MADVFYATENQKTTEEMNESNVFYATEKQQGTFKRGDVYPGTFDDYSTYDYFTETQSAQSNDLQSSEDMKTINILVYITIALLLIVLALSGLLLFQKKKSKTSDTLKNAVPTEKPEIIKAKFNTVVSKKTFPKKAFIALGLIVILLLVALFTNYQKMPNKAKGELGTYLAKNLPNYTSMQNIYYTIDFNYKGFTVTLGGNVKNNNKESATLYSEIQFNHLMINPEIKTIKINNKKFTKENIERYVSNYWWN